MDRKIRQGMEAAMTAIVLAYMGMATLSHIRKFAPCQSSLLWLSAISAICGTLLAFSEESAERAIWAIVTASVLAILIFGSLWSYIWWALAGKYISLSELILSEFVLIYVVKRGFVMFVVNVLFGVLGIVVVPICDIHYSHK